MSDFLDGRPSDQLFAVRELKRLIRVSLTQERSRDPIQAIEARQSLVLFDEALAPACMERITDERLGSTCADILGLLETDAALPVLNEALQLAQKRNARRIRRAIRDIEES